MKHLRRRTVLLLLAAVVGAVAVFTVGASASRDDRLYVGFSLHFTGPDTTAGTFVMSGALEDAGTTEVENLSLIPIGNTDTARLSGNQTFTGANGTILARFEGKAFPLSSPHQVGQGRLEIVSGTGAYAALRGHARFLIVVDAGSNQLIGTAQGSIHDDAG
jgi:hypothetical protein